MMSTVDQIKINSKSTLADIIVGFIRYTEDKQLVNRQSDKKRVDNIVEVSEQICKYCKDKYYRSIYFSGCRYEGFSLGFTIGSIIY